MTTSLLPTIRRPKQCMVPGQHPTCSDGGRPGTALDAAALDRGTSIYMVDGVIPMLPRLLCEQLCSLTPGDDHLTFSVIWRLGPVRMHSTVGQHCYLPVAA